MKINPNHPKMTIKYFRGCYRKKRYKNPTKLREAADRMDKFYCGRVAIHGYFCKYCGGFHLTTKEHSEEEIRNSNDLVF